MSDQKSIRKVKLVDTRTPGHPVVPADLYRDMEPFILGEVERQWSDARKQAATSGQGARSVVLEHSHWDWRNKAESVEAGLHLLVAIEHDGEIQGILAALRTPRPAKLGGGQVVYVDYVESAPWNLKGLEQSPRFKGVGMALIADVVRLSLEMGLDGRVGLHALPKAEPFYARCGMTRVGPDDSYYHLAYYEFEFTGRQAVDWLISKGESP